MPKRERFTIAKIDEEKEKKVEPEKFATPYGGTNAKDKATYPYVKYDNEGRQYDMFKSNDINIMYSGEEDKPKVDKYDPSRIPSWLRAESNSGISKHNLSDLKGEKPSDEEVLERNRQMYGTTYQEAIRLADEDRRRKEEELKNVETIKDPINLDNPRYNFGEDDNNVNEDLFKNEPPKYEEVIHHSAFDGYEKTTVEERIIEEKKEYQESTIKNDGVDYYEKPTLMEEPKPEDEPIEEVKVEPKTEVIDDLGDVVPRAVVKEPRKERATISDSGLVFGNPKARYVAPPLELLKRNGEKSSVDTDAVNYQISVINRTFEDFKVGGKVITYTKGPTVTQFEVKLDPGVNVNKVTSLQRNLQMNLESESIRIQAPIPGKSTIGIEAPNAKKDVVLFGDLVADPKFLKDGKPLNVILGLSIDGESVSADIAEMPHGLIAGATGSGKTVCMYSMILSMIYKASPEEVKMILVDPKRNELIYFEDIPHLATPIVDDPKLATAALKWAVDEMDRRYDFLKANRKRTIADYNAYAKANGLKVIPYIVIIIDEFADLMGTASESFETNVQRITQKARSAGIHLIVATQRPTTDVIKGTIKANIPTRMALSVNSQTDSLTILDHVGAEKLLGKGDMLYTRGASDKRIQGCYVSNGELDSISTFYLEQDLTPNYMFTHDDLQKLFEQENNMGGNSAIDGDPLADEYFEDVARFVFRQRKASANQIQNTFGIGFNRANKIIMGLADLGIVSSDNIQGKAREVRINDIEELEEILRNR